MLFKTVIGATDLKKKLITLSKSSTTLLFTGPQGSPTLPLALAYATYLHCHHPLPTDACGTCPSCTKMLRLTHPDLHLTFPIGTTSHTKTKDVNTNSFINEWRAFCQDDPYGNLQDWSKKLQDEAKTLQISKAQVHQIKQISTFKPFQSKHAIILIWLPEHLHPAAANALLKTLEEPSQQTIFILVAHDTTRLLPTVYSRTLEIYVPPLTDHDMLVALQQHYPTLPPTQHSLLVQVAQGDFSKAKKLATNQAEDYLEQFAQWLRAIYTQDWTTLVNLTDELYKRPLQIQKNWLVYGIHIIRGSLLLSFHQQALAQLTQKELAFCQKFSQASTPEQLQRIVPYLEQAHAKLHRYAHSKLNLLHLAIQTVPLLMRHKV